MTKGEFYIWVHVRETKSQTAQKVSGWIDGDLGIRDASKRANEKDWQVTHLPTGMLITTYNAGFRTRSGALNDAKAKLAAMLPDWLDSEFVTRNKQDFEESIRQLEEVAV